MILEFEDMIQRRLSKEIAWSILNTEDNIEKRKMINYLTSKCRADFLTEIFEDKKIDLSKELPNKEIKELIKMSTEKLFTDEYHTFFISPKIIFTVNGKREPIILIIYIHNSKIKTPTQKDVKIYGLTKVDTKVLNVLKKEIPSFDEMKNSIEEWAESF